MLQQQIQEGGNSSDEESNLEIKENQLQKLNELKKLEEKKKIEELHKRKLLDENEINSNQ